MLDDARRIDITLLDEELKGLINASAKIFPLADVSNLPAHHDKDYYRITSGVERNNVYAWVEESAKYELIGADDRDVPWSDVTSKPTTFPPSPHTHAWSNVEGKPMMFPPTAHTHDWTEVTGKPASYTPSAHDHNDAYYTKPDVNGMLLLKADQVTLEAHLTDFGIHMTPQDKSAILLISGKADKTYVDAELVKKADSTTLKGHTSNTAIHVTQADKDRWNKTPNQTKTNISEPADAIVGDYWFKEV